MQPNILTATPEERQIAVSEEMFRQMIYVNIAGGHRYTYSVGQIARQVRTPSVVVNGLEKAQANGTVAFNPTALEVLKSLADETRGEWELFAETVAHHPLGTTIVRAAPRPALNAD